MLLAMLPARWSRSAVALLALAALAAPALAEEEGAAPAATDPSQAYADCMTLARESPEDGFESALAWQAVGGGVAAQHCAAVALIELGEFGEAASRLEKIATDVPADKPWLAAELLGQAGRAWLMVEDVDRAYSAQTAALGLEPDNVELLIDRSIALATAGRYWEALDDLNRASELAPDRADILVLRATAYRYVEGLELAMEDVERALRLDPENPDALLERGILRRLTGDADGARRDWLRVAALVPDTPVAEAARRNLENLDLKVE